MENNLGLSNDATTIIITTKDNKVLLQLRDQNPNIEFPGFTSLLSGYINSNETPKEALIRELKEEISHKKAPIVNLSAITYLGSIQRFDFKRNDYIHHAYLIDEEEDLIINEGKGLIFCSYEECLNRDDIAPHHKYYLHRFQDNISKIDFSSVSKKVFDIVPVNDYVDIFELNKGKDLNKLENGIGFFEGEDNSFTSLVHFEEDIKFIGYLNFQPNTPRGNHYHLRKVEYMLLLNGEMKSEVRLRSNENEKMEVTWKQGQIIRILPGAIHTITAISESTVAALEFSPQRFLNSDVYKLK